ncbi:hypothetical protein GQ457_10G008630 [Hibiscus cannabinus]
MEVAMIHANIDDEREATMARFLAGLDLDIANVVELQHYIDIDDVVHMAIKVEKQLKRKGAAHPYASITSKWGHGSYKKNVAIPTKDGSGSSKPNKPIIKSNKESSCCIGEYNKNVMSNTYNPTWRKHPNFSWKNQNNTLNQQLSNQQGYQNQPSQINQPRQDYQQPSNYKTLENTLNTFMTQTSAYMERTDQFIQKTYAFMDRTEMGMQNQEAALKSLENQVGLNPTSILPKNASKFTKERLKHVKASLPVQFGIKRPPTKTESDQNRSNLEYYEGINFISNMHDYATTITSKGKSQNQHGEYL